MKVGPITIAALAMILAACKTSPALDRGTHPDESYFPVGQLEPGFDEIDALKRRWFGNVLRAMGEAPLARPSAATVPTVRVLYLGSFGSASCVTVQPWQAGVRVTKTSVVVEDETADVQVIQGPEIRRFELPRAIWTSLQHKLRHADLWTPRDSTEDELLTFDGWNLSLEYYDGAQWRQADRHCPEKDGPFAEFLHVCTEINSLEPRKQGSQ